MARLAIVVAAGASFVALAGCGTPVPGIYVSHSGGALICRDGIAVENLVQKCDAVVVARVTGLGARPHFYCSGVAGPSPQVVHYEVIEVIKGRLSPGDDLHATYWAVPDAKYVVRGRGPEHLDPTYFRERRRFILLIPHLGAEEEAAGRARKQIREEAQRMSRERDPDSMTIVEWLKYGQGADEEWPWSGPVVDIPDEELTNPYSKRLAACLRSIVRSAEWMRQVLDETDATH